MFKNSKMFGLLFAMVTICAGRAWGFEWTPNAPHIFHVDGKGDLWLLLVNVNNSYRLPVEFRGIVSEYCQNKLLGLGTCTIKTTFKSKSTESTIEHTMQHVYATRTKNVGLLIDSDTAEWVKVTTTKDLNNVKFDPEKKYQENENGRTEPTEKETVEKLLALPNFKERIATRQNSEWHLPWGSVWHFLFGAVAGFFEEPIKDRYGKLSQNRIVDKTAVPATTTAFSIAINHKRPWQSSLARATATVGGCFLGRAVYEKFFANKLGKKLA